MKKNKKNSKPNVKESFISDEINGTIPKHRKKSEKHLDLTEEIKTFLKNSITIDSVKYILTRLHGRASMQEAQREQIKITRLGTFIKHDHFIITISSKKLEYTFYLNSFGLYDLCFFNVTNECTSSLKCVLSHKIYRWLCEKTENIGDDKKFL